MITKASGFIGFPDIKMKPVVIPTAFHSNLLDNAKARQMLGWTPRYDLGRLIEAAFAYERAPDDPRIIWYPG